VRVVRCHVRCSIRCLSFFFFFFQAEDGIRDKLVTGVQTCALPISRRILDYSFCCRTGCSANNCSGRRRDWDRRTAAAAGCPRGRSEERRVGKECGARWGREQCKKKEQRKITGSDRILSTNRIEPDK